MMSTPRRARLLVEAIILWGVDGRPDQAQTLRAIDQRMQLQYADHDVVNATKYVERRLQEREQGNDDSG